MSNGHLAIIGCGDIGTRVGRQLVHEGWRVSALRRSAGKLPSEFDGFAGDYSRCDDLAPLLHSVQRTCCLHRYQWDGM